MPKQLLSAVFSLFLLSYVSSEAVRCKFPLVSGVCKTSDSNCIGVSVEHESCESNSFCCLLEPKSPKFFIPEATSGDLCSSDDFEGVCADDSDCSGAVMKSTDCSNLKSCCVAETDLVLDLVRSGETKLVLDFTQFSQIFEDDFRSEALFPYFNFALASITVDSESLKQSCFRSAAFASIVSQLSAEEISFPSSGFKEISQAWTAEKANFFVSEVEQSVVVISNLLKSVIGEVNELQLTQKFTSTVGILGCAELTEVNPSKNGSSSGKVLWLAAIVVFVVAFVGGIYSTKIYSENKQKRKEQEVERVAPLPWPKFSATDNPLFDDDSPF